jgi:hypothetical protein
MYDRRLLHGQPVVRQSRVRGRVLCQAVTVVDRVFVVDVRHCGLL